MRFSDSYKILQVVFLAGIVLWTEVGCSHPAPDRRAQIPSRAYETPRMNPLDGIRPRPSREPDRTLSRVPTSPRSTSMPSYPFPKTQEKPYDKAKKLLELARQENRNLSWDECLAAKALQRARRMVQDGNFSHEDPRTGRNPAWNLVASCFRPSYAGENLTKDEGQSARAIHQALMESPTHRRNILNSNFELLGIGCHENVCVQLFAGF